MKMMHCCYNIIQVLNLLICDLTIKSKLMIADCTLIIIVVRMK